MKNTFNAAFWKWFGDSVLVDSKGQPLVVYHGTNSRFRKFDTKKSLGVIWFTSDVDKIINREAGAQGNKIILDLYVSIEKPAGWKEYDRLMLEQIDRDYDGVILPDDDGHFDGFVWNPKQLKSASKNDGTWDRDDASLRSNPKRRRR